MMDPAGTGLFWLWPLLVVVGVLLLGYVLVQVRVGGRSDSRDEARRVLDERFARGEIDEDEYRRRRSVLRGRPR